MNNGATGPMGASLEPLRGAPRYPTNQDKKLHALEGTMDANLVTGTDLDNLIEKAGPRQKYFVELASVVEIKTIYEVLAASEEEAESIAEAYEAGDDDEGDAVFDPAFPPVLISTSELFGNVHESGIWLATEGPYDPKTGDKAIGFRWH